MADFDPYLTWLGIPLTQRPPTCYQLLGVDPAIKEPAAIKALAIQKISYVRNFQRGEHGELCARLLEELSLAEATLTDSAKRAEYDRSLSAAAAEAAEIAAALQPRVERAAPARAVVVKAVEEPPRRKKAKRRKGSDSLVQAGYWVGAAAVAGLLIVFAATLVRSIANRGGETAGSAIAPPTLATNSPAKPASPPANANAPRQESPIAPPPPTPPLQHEDDYIMVPQRDGPPQKMPLSSFEWRALVSPKPDKNLVTMGDVRLDHFAGYFQITAHPSKFRQGIEVTFSKNGYRDRTVKALMEKGKNKCTIQVQLYREGSGEPYSTSGAPTDFVFVSYFLSPIDMNVRVVSGKAAVRTFPDQQRCELYVEGMRSDLSDGVELECSSPGYGTKRVAVATEEGGNLFRLLKLDPKRQTKSKKKVK